MFSMLLMNLQASLLNQRFRFISDVHVPDIWFCNQRLVKTVKKSLSLSVLKKNNNQKITEDSYIEQNKIPVKFKLKILLNYGENWPEWFS